MIAAILHFLGGIVARFLGPILAGAAGWFSRGQREKLKQARAENKALKTAKEVRDEVEGKRPDAVRSDLDRWMRD